MMRVLLDTNVVLDVLLRREPWVRAKTLPGNDFEDNLQIASATIAGLDAIVTRNPDHFKSAPVTVLTPAEALARIS